MFVDGTHLVEGAATAWTTVDKTEPSAAKGKGMLVPLAAYLAAQVSQDRSYRVVRHL